MLPEQLTHEIDHLAQQLARCGEMVRPEERSELYLSFVRRVLERIDAIASKSGGRASADEPTCNSIAGRNEEPASGGGDPCDSLLLDDLGPLPPAPSRKITLNITHVGRPPAPDDPGELLAEE